MFERLGEGPQIRPHDAERRQSLLDLLWSFVRWSFLFPRTRCLGKCDLEYQALPTGIGCQDIVRSRTHAPLLSILLVYCLLVLNKCVHLGWRSTGILIENSYKKTILFFYSIGCEGAQQNAKTYVAECMNCLLFYMLSEEELDKSFTGSERIFVYYLGQTRYFKTYVAERMHRFCASVFTDQKWQTK